MQQVACEQAPRTDRHEVPGGRRLPAMRRGALSKWKIKNWKPVRRLGNKPKDKLD